MNAIIWSSCSVHTVLMKNTLLALFLIKVFVLIYKFLLLDGSRRNIRSQLAEDGCPESQVVLAKQLLDEKTGNIRSL